MKKVPEEVRHLLRDVAHLVPLRPDPFRDIQRAHQSKVVEISCQPPGTKVVAASGPQVPLA
ncbi:Uncharacterised protein [Mycobacterium tuberculosis]|nr:Uncharacterised protein [Mycobacterium tuberculosis]